MNNNPETIIPYTRKEINAIRHPKERFIYIIAVIINILAVIAVCSYVAKDITYFYEEIEIMAEREGVTVAELDPRDIRDLFYDEFYDPKNQQKVQIYMTAAAVYLFTVAALEYLYAMARSRAVRVTPEQFPDIYNLANGYAAKLGLKKLPEIYIAQENGVLNAFSSNIIRKKFIQIDADLLEIAYRQYKDIGSIGFVLAHELAHIKLRHVSIWIRYTVMLSQLIPIVGHVLSRVREYSCDRLAQAVSQNSGIEAMMALTTGKHLYKNTNVYDYLSTSKEIKGFWIWIVNLYSTHPILPKRIKALFNPVIPGKLF